MRGGSNAARWHIVDSETGHQSVRARALLERLARLDIDDMTEREARDILGVARETYVKLRDGLTEGMRPSSFTKMEKALDAYVEKHDLHHLDKPPAPTPLPAPSSAETFEMTVKIGALDVQATVKARPEDADLARQQLELWFADMMRGRD
jgi:hypothetical protein